MEPPERCSITSEEEEKELFSNDPRALLRGIIEAEGFHQTSLAHYQPCPFQCKGCAFCRWSLAALVTTTKGYLGPLKDTECPEYGMYAHAVTVFLEGDSKAEDDDCKKPGVRVSLIEIGFRC